MTDVELATRFFLQLAVILAACRLMGWLGARFLGQTQVVMEMVTGVILGPSLFGLIAPSWQSWLFPKEASSGAHHPSMSVLYVGAQVGLVLYMFLVGLEFDTAILKRQARSAVGVSISGIALPFLLGALAALSICRGSTYFQNGVSPWEGACFLGAAMCITAFPVLARIITERGLLGTSIGTLALAAGATNDAIAWIILAVVLATFKSTPMIAFVAIGGGVVYVLAMTTLGRRLMTAFEKAVEGKDHLPTPIAALAFLVLIACAWYTETIGIYAVFGAFVCGACMPHGHFAALMKRVLEPITGGLLVPLYFVYAGLNAKVQLLGSPAALGIGAVLILLAIAGKWGGCMLAARRAGETWRDSASIGILMNARGLMELVILNIGLQAGVITQTLYTVMVLMAIVTTLMTTPIYGLLNRRAKQAVMNAEPA